MTLPFAIDDAEPVPGKKALYFPGSRLSSVNSTTLGYECTVLGQVRKRRSRQREKCFLVHIDHFNAPFIAKESELVPCIPTDVPPIRSQGEIVIAWRDSDGDPQITGTYRASPWLPRTTFVIRYGDTCEGRYRKTNENGVEYLTYEAPPGVKLDDEFVVNALSQVTGQRFWRVLPWIS